MAEEMSGTGNGEQQAAGEAASAAESTPATAVAPPIVARGGQTYRRYRYIMFALMICFSVWFLYDGFKRWPEENRLYALVSDKIAQLESDRLHTDNKALADLRERQKQIKNHTEFSVALQKILGFALTPAALGLLVFWLRRSRGEYRLDNGVLHVPGHPPVPLECISTLDKTKWDRKGIAFAEYQLGTGQRGRFRLDDFIYDAHPIRDIVKQIEASILQRAAALGVLRPPPPVM